MSASSQYLTAQPTGGYANQQTPDLTLAFMPDEVEFVNAGYTGGTGGTSITYSFDGVNDAGVINPAGTGVESMRGPSNMKHRTKATKIWLKGGGRLLVMARTDV